MRAPPNEKAVPFGIGDGSSSTDRLASTTCLGCSNAPSLRQQTAELTGVLRFMAHWRDRTADLIARAEAGDFDAIMKAESAVAAFLLAVDALREWRGVA